MKGIKTVSIALVLVMIFTGAALAGGFGRHHGGGHGGFGRHGMGGGMGLKALMHLDLSDTQKAEVAEVFTKYQEDREDVRNSIMTARENLFTAIHADEFSEAGVRQASQAVASVMEEGAVLKAKIVAEVKPILTPEQIALMKERRAKRTEKMKERREFKRSMHENWLQTESE
ncbi:MAG TPA: periplasmic heavy metal sensor [Desulfobacterales bacterium]|nr:MAG: hypothetical protein DRI57_07160 [Deltaproteobacteria bacterium]HHC24666.1 periplasmic heavy metal sensor [Desulfobacterales bacterium]